MYQCVVDVAVYRFHALSLELSVLNLVKNFFLVNSMVKLRIYSQLW